MNTVSSLLAELDRVIESRGYIARVEILDFGKAMLDELDGVWHRHPVANPDFHNTSAEGRRPVTLEEFMDEVEQVIDELGL